MEDQPALKKAKLGSSTSFDDGDLDGFSELEAMTNDSHSSMPNGATVNGGPSMGNPMMPSSSHMQPQQQGQPGQQYHPNANQPSSTQSSQGSVLQELLLSTSTSSAMNSPRPPPTSTFMNRSSMPSNAGQNMMSPPTPGMSMQQRMYHHQMRQPGPGPHVYDPSMSQSGQMPVSNFQPTAGGMVSNQQAPQHYAANYGSSMHQSFRPPMGFNGQPPSRGNAPANAAMRGGMMVNGAMNQQTATGPRAMRPPSNMQMPAGHGPQPMQRPMMINQPGPVGAQPMPQGPYDQGPPGYSVPSSMAGNMMPPSRAQPPMSDSYNAQPGTGQSHGNLPHMQQPHPASSQGYPQMNASGMMPSRPGFAPGQTPGQPAPVSNPSGQPMPQRMGDMPMVHGQQPNAQVLPNAMFNGPMGAQKAGMPAGMPQVGQSQPQLPPVHPQQQPMGNQVPQQAPLSGGMNGTPASQQGRISSSSLPQASTPGQSQDPEKRKLIQQQLVLLLHAHKCAAREKQDPQGNRVQCNLPHCSTMKDVLEHMTSCNNGRACGYAHCASSRQIITHWKNCSKTECPVCNPLKNFTNNPAGGRASDPINSNAFSSIQTGSSTGSFGGVSSAGSMLSSFNSPPSNSAGLSSAGASLLADYNSSSFSDPFRSTNPPNKIAPVNPGKGGALGMGINLGNEGLGNLPTPDPPNNAKEWHASITQDLRNHLVGKLVKAIFPSPDPAAIHDQRIKDLISYARKVEKEMFEVADDKEEYYHLLAEKIYKIQKELQEKKNKRINEAQQQQHGGPRPDGDAPQRPGSTSSLTSQPQMQQQNAAVAQISNALRDVKSEADMINAAALNLADANGALNRVIKTEDTGCSDAPGTSGEGIKKEEPRSPVAAAKTPAQPSVPPTPKPQPKEDIPEDEKVFDANELRNYLKPVWEKLDRAEEAVPFRVPVDPELLKIPDYFDIIKKPMDLMTICQRLDRGEYKNPWEFCDDMWLMFDNAWLYNRKNSKVYKWCTKLSETFVEEINPVMRQMGYCCGQKLAFTPLALFCYGQSMCVIARDQPYYLYEAGSTQYGVTVTDRYIYCTKCFEALPEEGINLSEGPNDPPNMAPKAKFQLKKNDQIDTEPFDACKVCKRKWHRICANYSKKVYPEGFICEGCRVEKSRPKPDNKFTAKKLPHTNLSKHIEDRVNGYINKTLDEDSRGQCEVVIRVLCSAEKEVEVKPLMKQKYAPMGFPEKFPYKSKAIFAFEVIDGVEVCFFGLHVQEYGSNCPAPNRRRVYIAYLDSVHFFQPRHLRTDVYHEILLGYLEYVRTLGYTMAHIWACPPSEGDDYIFHCHPPEQKIPKPKRLQDWYRKMLDKGKEENTVNEYKDIYRQAKDDDLQTPMTLPYFEGDFWPNIIEDCIRDADKEDNERKRQEDTQQQQFDDDDDDIFEGADSSKKNSKTSKKKSNKKSNTKSKKKGNTGTGNQVTDKLLSVLEKHKEVFFTIRLVSHQTEMTVNQKEIVDPDSLMASELMDGRDTFLNRAREEHWEFSSLRRAKWSTLNFCHALHTQDSASQMTYTCNSCNNNAAFHCNQCEDFDLCANCFKEGAHEHPMEKISSLIEVDSSKSADASNSRNESVKRCIASLVHACQCRDSNCRRPTCHKMKKVVQHTKFCKKRQQTNCPVCKQLIALCCYHAKHCNLSMCPVPFCSNIRQKLQEQKRSQNRRADMMMRRRMEKLQAGGANGPSSMQSSSHAGPSHPAMGAPQSQPSPHFGNVASSTNGSMLPSQQSGMPQQSMMPQTGGGQTIGSGMGGMNQAPQVQQFAQQHMSQGGMGQMNPQMQFQGQQGGNFQGPSQVQQQPGMANQQQFMPGNQVRGPTMQNQMNPPPYGRQPQQPPGNFGNNSVMNASSGYVGQQGQMMQGNMPGQATQMRPNMPTMQQQDAMKDPQMKQILLRLRQSQTSEERQQIFGELKKTPHLFAAFLKMKANSNERMPQQNPQHNAGQPMQQQQPQQPPPHQWQQSQYGQHPQPGPAGPRMGAHFQQQGPPQPQHAQWAAQQQQYQRQMQAGSPHMQQQQQAFNQVRSPRGPMGRSPSVGGMVPSPMGMNNQQPPQVMLQQDQSGNPGFR